MKLSGNWLKDYVSYRGSVEKVAEDLTMAGLEVEKLEKVLGGKDSCLEVEITTNRPDWISHIGVAREISAVSGLTLKLPKPKLPSGRTKPKGWDVQIKDKEKCPYYTAVYVEGITHAQTPAFMKQRLEACGLRSIGLIVDITNYVLLETGQPLHAFDANLLENQTVVVRAAKAKEKFVAIDGTEHELSADDLVIADAKKPVALAGVMGGQNTEVTSSTQNILLESAFFQPRTVRLSSKKHQLASDSSYRFERRVDPEGVDFASQRALELIIEYAKPKSVSAVVSQGKPPIAKQIPIKISSADVERSLGVAIPNTKIRAILTRLGLKVTGAGSSLNVTVPTFRPDLTRAIDLIEEIARIYGYDKIPETLPAGTVLHADLAPRLKLERDLRYALSGMGLDETVTFSLISDQGLAEEDLKDAVSIVNPQNRELCWMRPTLATSLLNVARHNLNFGAKRVAIYEIANTYRQPSQKKMPIEDRVVGILLVGNWKEKSWMDAERSASFYDLKGVVQSLGMVSRVRDLQFKSSSRSFLSSESTETVMSGSKALGFVGEVDASILKSWGIDERVFYAEVQLDALCDQQSPTEKVSDLPRYPAIDRDLAVVVGEDVKSGDIQKVIEKIKEPLLKKVELFDLFRGGRVPKGYKNLAFRLTYQSADKTLVSEDIQAIHTAIADKVTEQFQASFQ